MHIVRPHARTALVTLLAGVAVALSGCARMPGMSAPVTSTAGEPVHDVVIRHARIAPGFIDMLGHSEFSLLRQPRALSKITQGITSAITGEVQSAWPNTKPTARETRPAAEPWSSLAGYFAELEHRGTAINPGTYVAAGSVRRAVMGDASRHPTTLFSTGELTTLARRAARYGGGYASHIRNEGAGLHDAVRAATRIGRDAGTWVEIRHLKASGESDWGRRAGAVALIDSARRAGLDAGRRCGR